MTDEQMDARLQRAGEAWRAASVPVAEAAAESHVETLMISSTGGPRRPRRTGLFASAAIVVAALVAGGALLIANIGSGGDRQTSAGGTVDLVGTPWTLTAIADANGDDVPVAGDAVLAFGPDSRFKGNDGCNGIGGRAHVSGSTIDFGKVATTEVKCLDDQVAATAEHVDAILSGKVTWAIDSDRLTLTKPGTGTLVYRASRPPTAKMAKSADLGVPSAKAPPASDVASSPTKAK